MCSVRAERMKLISCQLTATSTNRSSGTGCLHANVRGPTASLRNAVDIAAIIMRYFGTPPVTGMHVHNMAAYVHVFSPQEEVYMC